MRFELTDEQKEIRKAVREFAEGEFPDVAQEYDRSGKFPFDIWKKACELGLVGINIPEEYGGAGLGFVEKCIVAEECSRVDPGCANAAFTVTLGIETIMLFGTEEQKQKYVTPVVDGRKIMGIAITEPDAGSDVAGVKTTAVKEGDCWILNGNKMFITNGTIGDHIVVLAVTHPGEKKKHRTMSTFIVETKTPGYEASKIEGKMGARASDTAEIVFNNAAVPDENLLGTEKMGFYNIMEFFNRSRTYIGAGALGVAQGALEMAVKHAKQRKTFGRPLIYNQGIQFKLAEMATRVEAARNLVYKAAWNVDRGNIDHGLVAMAKWYAAETSVYVTDESLQIHGGYGYIDEYPIERFYRAAKVAEIYEGAKEIEKMIVANSMMGGA